MKILVTGGNGLLATELKKIDGSLICLDRSQLDVRDFERIDEIIQSHRPDIIIHCAAVKDNRKVEKDPAQAINTNIVGTALLSTLCIAYNVRLVYISTDYVYQGTHGQCKETDPVLPYNQYAWTKLGGECSVQLVPNHLIIRTSFGPSEFEYKQAFVDKWSSKDYVDRIAPMILEATKSPLTGVLNIGTDRKALYQHASERNEVVPVKISDKNFFTPYDTSLNLQKWQDYKASPLAKTLHKCRVCDSEDLTKYLDLGLMPMANNLDYSALRARSQERFPLQVLRCNTCNLSQLSVIVDPKAMFSNYAYRSSINGPYVNHCRQMAIDLKEKYKLDSDTLHVDIAGNDGALLDAFGEVLNHRRINVDPAENLTAIAESNGIECITDFWSLDVAKLIVQKYGYVDLITATNVFAHLDDVHEFIEACALALSDKGVLIIENPYLLDFIQNNEFDTVYFEHVSYWSVRPICRMADRYRLHVIHVEKQDIHGGTMRYVLAPAGVYDIDPSVKKAIDSELHFDGIDIYSQWQRSVEKTINTFQSKIFELKKSGNKIVGFGASAKGQTLLACAKMTTDLIDYIIDETPEKINKFQPGTGIPIVNKSVLARDQPDYIILLAWNFADALMSKAREAGFNGKFIIPIPKFTIIE